MTVVTTRIGSSNGGADDSDDDSDSDDLIILVYRMAIELTCLCAPSLNSYIN